MCVQHHVRIDRKLIAGGVVAVCLAPSSNGSGVQVCDQISTCCAEKVVPKAKCSTMMCGTTGHKAGDPSCAGTTVQLVYNGAADSTVEIDDRLHGQSV